MDKPGYTPGPWRVFTTTDGSKLIGIGELNGGGITDCGFGVWRGGDAEAIANARLIAAAPDLIEALQDILEYSGGAASALDDEYVMDRARAALSKALGEGQVSNG
jgi:hypothetical protein